MNYVDSTKRETMEYTRTVDKTIQCIFVSLLKYPRSQQPVATTY